MRRAERLFDIIQLLRGQSRPQTGASLAARLEVGVRTIYRDIAALQASGVPIEGEAGVGYVLRAGFDLPPLMFTAEEVQTVAVALDLIGRTGDRGLQEAAERVRAKIAAVLPGPLRDLQPAPFFVSTQGARNPNVCMSEVREAIRAGRKLDLEYADRDERISRRVIWPLAIAYYMEATLIGAWCELRGDYRHFRTDRVKSLAVRGERFPGSRPTLLAGWRALHDGWRPDGAPPPP